MGIGRRAVRPGLVTAALLLGIGFLGAVTSCGGPKDDPAASGPTASEQLASQLPANLVAQSWPLAVATDTALQPYSSSGGWIALVKDRHLKQSVTQLGPAGGVAAARPHADAAGMFRQAALASAQALIQTYGKTPKDTDPIGAAHLLTVSYALVGDLDSAREQAALLEGVEDPSLAWHDPWKAYLDGGAAWPPDLSGLPLALPPPTPGQWPELTTLPHYSLPERAGTDTSVDMGDPAALFALALWHDQAAYLAAGDQASLVDVYGARYRLPGEEPVTATDAMPMEMLFGADYLTEQDAAFMAALTGEQGAAAVDAFKDTSLLAAMADLARVDGKIDNLQALDLIAGFRKDLLEDLEAAAGTQLSFHVTFAKIAEVGAMRALALVAEVEGDRNTSGKLRINAMEKSVKEAGCPVYLLSLAAWDAENRYPMRASDILHSLTRRYPSLEASRYALDVLAVRVGREQVTSTPGM